MLSLLLVGDQRGDHHHRGTGHSPPRTDPPAPPCDGGGRRRTPALSVSEKNAFCPAGSHHRRCELLVYRSLSSPVFLHPRTLAPLLPAATLNSDAGSACTSTSLCLLTSILKTPGGLLTLLLPRSPFVNIRGSLYGMVCVDTYDQKKRENSKLILSFLNCGAPYSLLGNNKCLKRCG